MRVETSPISPPPPARYRWYILALAGLTGTLVVAAPTMALPVLFKEIATRLNLDLVQVGMVWGIGALPGVVMVLAAGAAGDRLGPKRVLVLGCLLTGLAGALRGAATDFYTLAGAVFIFGVVAPFVQMNTVKTCGLWFTGKELGLANGVLSMGMALGFLIGSLFSATRFSPLLGGWSNVLYAYGAIAALFAVPWCFTRPAPHGHPAIHAGSRPSLGRLLGRVARVRNVWLLGIAILGIGGCVQGALGYLPLYLRGLGWADVHADGALAAFNTISMVFVMPIALLSNRLGSRKLVLIGAGLMITLGVGLLSAVEGGWIWAAVLLAGLVRDGFMGVFMTAILESKGVGPVYAGTATGMVMVFSGVGNLLAPPMGNRLAIFDPALPFLFWSAMTLVGLAGLILLKDDRGAKS